MTEERRILLILHYEDLRLWGKACSDGLITREAYEEIATGIQEAIKKLGGR